MFKPSAYWRDGFLFLECAKMPYESLDQYPIDYLIANKNKTSDYYVFVKNTCVYLLDGSVLSEEEISISWNTFLGLVFVFGFYQEDKLWRKICRVFNKCFNHTNLSSIEFMLWHFSDLMNETLKFAHEFDWNKNKQTHIHIPSFKKRKRKRENGSSHSKQSSDWFETEYMSKGGGQMKTPEIDDLRLFAREALKFIEEPKLKKSLQELTIDRMYDWLPEDIQRTLDQIGKLTLSDGKMLVDSKPLLENWKKDFALQGGKQASEQKKEPPKPPEPKQRGGKIDLWLDWYHAMLDGGFKCTLEQIARKSGYSLGYVKQKHMIYKARPNPNT